MGKLPDNLERMKSAVHQTNTARKTSSIPKPELEVSYLQARLRANNKFKEAGFINDLSNKSEGFKQWLAIFINLCKKIACNNSDPEFLVKVSDRLLFLTSKIKAIRTTQKYEQKVLLEICFSLGRWHDSFAQVFTECESEAAWRTLPIIQPKASDPL